MKAMDLRSDILRSREVDRYYRPKPLHTKNESLIDRSQSSNDFWPTGTAATLQGDPALVAFAQLVAWRLNASLAIISLIDRKYQYLLADSMAFNQKIGHLHKGSLHDTWPGSANVLIDDLPCGKTVSLPIVPDYHPLFVVPDLSKDTRFNQLPFVSGPPFMRFYAGTPIKSPKGINIGSLFILDEMSRPGLTPDQQQILGETAKGVMQSIETARAADECRRRIRMDYGLSALFEGERATLRAPKTQSPAGTIDQGSAEAGNIEARHASTENGMQRLNISLPLLLDVKHNQEDVDRFKLRPETPPTSLIEPNSHSPTIRAKETASRPDSQNAVPEQREMDRRRKVYSYSAKILYRALQLGDGGGVVFLHSAAVVNNPEPFNAGSKTLIDVGSNEKGYGLESNGPQSMGIIEEKLPSSSKESRKEPKESLPRLRTAEDDTVVLGSCYATTMTRSNKEEKLSLLPFYPIKRRTLAELADLYPLGMLWSNEDLGFSSAGEERHAKDPQDGNETKEILGVSDYDVLSRHFPGARQVMFIALQGSGSSNCVTACIAWSTSVGSSWNQDFELPFGVTFGHCVVAEIAKLDIMVAEQQKHDFIGSISHELRSPLHGILASVEFLGETRCDVFQKSLVDTVDSCGRTLLDTINHVLDFSKINSFENNWLEVRTSQHELVHGVHTGILNGNAATTGSKSGALLNIYSEINVAAICEEVVEGLCAGQHFRETASIDFTDITAGAGGRNSILVSTGNHALQSAPSVKPGSRESMVEVLLDIQKKDWRFITQPGALRRVIMNIVGNALKYTEQGWVKIKLEAQDSDQNLQSSEQEHRARDHSIISFTVTDSGKGISEEFLRTRLYTAFAQEDVLAPGTGLGLSLVQSIVNMLQGTIDIQSEVGRGTEVKVQLPLKRAFQNTEKTVSSPILGGSSRDDDDSITILYRLAKGKTIALYGFDSNVISGSRAMGETLAHYVTEWFGLTKVSVWLPSSQADIVIADEIEMPALLAHGPKFPGSLLGPLLVILCSDAVRYGQTSVYAAGGGVIEFVTKPIGPYKLAKALRHCLSRATEAQRAALDKTNPINLTATSTVDADITTLPVILSDESHKHNHETILSSADHNSPSKAGEKVHESRDTGKKILTPDAQKAWITTPSILVVDDNKINLKLLETFMNKRQYSNVGSASNGQNAVKAVEQADGYDIIFMDISMPILNGIEATRAIRMFEAKRRERAGNTVQNHARSLIIALTGLASVRDRAEAFDAGIDIYMTKPVSFIEVGKLLDNWKLHGRDTFRDKILGS